MAIKLTVEANDPEVEGLLEYLDANCKSGTPVAILHGKIALLERTLSWIKPAALLYGVNHEKVNLATASVCRVPTQKQAQFPSESLAAQEAEISS